MIKWSYDTTFIKGGQSLRTAMIISQICRNAREGSIFSGKKEAQFRLSKGKSCPTELLPWTMDLNLQTSLSAKNEVQRSTLRTPILLGSEHRTNGITACFVPSFPKGPPWKITQQSTSWPLLTN